MYNYFISSWGETFITIWVSISECKFILTLKFPRDLISLMGWINEGLILTFSWSSNTFEISVGFTDPYNSLFSVLNFLISYSLFLIFSWIDLASFFLSWSFLFSSCLIFSTSLIFSFEAKRAFFFEIRKFLAKPLFP